jgi:type VI secretion system FHA domain protein
MSLTIKATRYKGQPLHPPIEAVFDEQGGTLGRAPTNHLVLTDDEKVVSGEHATIKYENGGYIYIDSSLNGTLITNRNRRIHHDEIRLRDRDTLQIGEYDLVLTISGESLEMPAQQPLDAEDALSILDLNGDADRQQSHEQDDLWSGPFADPLANNSAQDDAQAVTTIHPDPNLSIDESFVPPELETPPGRASDLPEDLSLTDFFSDDDRSIHSKQGPAFFRDKLPEGPRGSSGSQGRIRNSIGADEYAATSQPVKRPPDTHRPPPAPGIVEDKVSVTPSKASSDLLAVFLEAAGIEDAAEHIMKDDATLMRVIGLVLHELVSGLMTVLRGRSELKSQLRVSMTTLKPTENNPFKFSPTVEEALKTCLMNNHPGFTDAVEAVREGYDDIKNHQLAVTAGIQASLAGILKQFDPQRFTDKFKEGLVLQKKAKCWDAFKQAYPQIVERAIEDIFGVDFIRAYEAQIEKLRAHRKKDHLRHER